MSNGKTYSKGDRKMGWLISNFESGDCKVVYIDVSIIDPAFEAFIDNYIVDICFMDNSFSINKAKKYIRNFIDTKDPDREKGVVAEFFLHLYLNSIEMEQECLFKNLEENSPKKGFDGVYKDSNGNVWFIESKSGVAESCSHKGKVQEAYRDLKDKFSSTTKNDPWLNAYNHFVIINPSDSLLDKFRSLSDEYDSGKVIDIKEYNIGPCGTVYDESGTTYDAVSLSDSVIKYFTGKEFNKLFSICVTQRAIKEFEKYLGK